ncbi:MAG TPA: hypothetical protein VGE58_02700 [Daejeonella sp.]
MSHKVDAADEKQLSSGCAEHDAKPLAGILMEMLFQKDVLLFKPQRPLAKDICGEHRKSAPCRERKFGGEIWDFMEG